MKKSIVCNDNVWPLLKPCTQYNWYMCLCVCASTRLLYLALIVVIVFCCSKSATAWFWYPLFFIFNSRKVEVSYIELCTVNIFIIYINHEYSKIIFYQIYLKAKRYKVYIYLTPYYASCKKYL